MPTSGPTKPASCAAGTGPDFHRARDCALMAHAMHPATDSMSEDFTDLEPIDVLRAAVVGPRPSPAWAPGWYADPWTAGQYRYWTGRAWTGETNRWGPATPDARPEPGRGTEPWPSALDRPVSSGYGWRRSRRPSPPAGDAVPSRARRRRGPLVAGSIALVVVRAASRARSATRSTPARTRTTRGARGSRPPAVAPSPDDSRPTPSPTIPRRAPSHRSRPARARAGWSCRRPMSAPARTVAADPARQPAQPADARPLQRHVPERSACAPRGCRSPTSTPTARCRPLSTEAVLYRDAATRRRRRSPSCARSAPSCPTRRSRARSARATERDDVQGAARRHVAAHALGRAAGVQHGRRRPSGQSPARSVAVYLRRGRALLGLYFPQPDGAQPAVAGKTIDQGHRRRVRSAHGEAAGVRRSRGSPMALGSRGRARTRGRARASRGRRLGDRRVGRVDAEVAEPDRRGADDVDRRPVPAGVERDRDGPRHAVEQQRSRRRRCGRVALRGLRAGSGIGVVSVKRRSGTWRSRARCRGCTSRAPARPLSSFETSARHDRGRDPVARDREACPVTRWRAPDGVALEHRVAEQLLDAVADERPAVVRTMSPPAVRRRGPAGRRRSGRAELRLSGRAVAEHVPRDEAADDQHDDDEARRRTT